jgi:hypothetical protein
MRGGKYVEKSCEPRRGVNVKRINVDQYKRLTSPVLRTGKGSSRVELFGERLPSGVSDARGLVGCLKMYPGQAFYTAAILHQRVLHSCVVGLDRLFRGEVVAIPS